MKYFAFVCNANVFILKNGRATVIVLNNQLKLMSTMDHFRVPLSLSIKASRSAKFLFW